MDEFTKQLAQGMGNLKYQGILENPTHIYDWDKSECGDRAKLYVRVENGLIVDASYEQLGCALNCLVFEKIIEQVINKPHSTLLNLSNETLTQILEVPERKVHCVMLALDTIHKGLKEKESY